MHRNSREKIFLISAVCVGNLLHISLYSDSLDNDLSLVLPEDLENFIVDLQPIQNFDDRLITDAGTRIVKNELNRKEEKATAATSSPLLFHISAPHIDKSKETSLWSLFPDLAKLNFGSFFKLMPAIPSLQEKKEASKAIGFIPMLPSANLFSDVAPNNNDDNENYELKSSFANGVGQVYFGAAVAYGRLEPGDDAFFSSDVIELDFLSNIKTKTGGVTYRAFAGALLNITEKVTMGGEIGYSAYPETRVAVHNAAILPFVEKIRATGNGVDILVNISTFFVPEFYFSFKPGVQLAFQKNDVHSNLSALTEALEELDIDLGSGISHNVFTNVNILPQVILSTGWNFIHGHFCGWSLSKAAINMELFYQHVWGNDEAPVDSRVSSRDMGGLTLGLRF